MKKVLSLVLTALMILSLGVTAVAEPAWQDQVTVAIDVLPNTLDPSSNAFPVLNQMVYDELINYNKLTKELEPALATAWSWVGDDSTVLHLDLCEGVVFHNGNPFTAEDVEFSLAHNSNANIAGYYDHCEIAGDYSVDVYLSNGNADFPYMLANALYAGILDKETCEADADFGTTVGTGPWALDLENSVDGDTYYLVRNDNYFGELPSASQMTLRYIKDSNARLISLQNKEIAAYMTVGETDRPTIDADANIEYCSGLGVGPAKMYYIAFNMKNGAAADNLYLRQAVACAINNAEVIAAYGDPGAVESDGAFWGFDTPYRASVEDFQEDLSYNEEKAKELVEKAKEQAGGELPVLKMLSNYAKTVNSTMCLAVQAECARIGLEIEIIESDSAGVLEMTKYANPGEYDMLQYNVPLESYASACNRMFVQDSNNNRAILNDDHVTELLMSAAATNDEAVREAAYKEVQVYVHDNAVYIPVYYGSRDGAQLTGVEGIIWANDGYPDFTYIKVPA